MKPDDIDELRDAASVAIGRVANLSVGDEWPELIAYLRDVADEIEAAHVENQDPMLTELRLLRIDRLRVAADLLDGSEPNVPG